jgi:hypothetical protein
MSARRMARDGHGLFHVSPGPAMPNPSMPCGWATPETALQLFLGWPDRRTGGMRLCSTLLDTTRRTPLINSSQHPGKKYEKVVQVAPMIRQMLNG